MKKTRVLSLLLISIAALLFLPSAQAHTALEASNPSTNEVVEFMPSEVTLTFSEDLISIEGEAVNFLTLRGIDGTNFEMINPVISGSVLSSKVGNSAHPAGKYILTYRVVSTDGHPVTGEVKFSTQSLTTIGSVPAEAEATPYLAKTEDSSPESVLYFAVGLLLALVSALVIKKRMGNGSRN